MKMGIVWNGVGCGDGSLSVGTPNNLVLVGGGVKIKWNPVGGRDKAMRKQIQKNNVGVLNWSYRICPLEEYKWWVASHIEVILVE